MVLVKIQTLFMLQRLWNKYKQLILIMLVGTNVYICVVFFWEEIGGTDWNSPVQLGNHMTILYATLGIEPGLQRWEAST